MSEALERIYRAYVAALNERRLDDLGQFVHDQLTYNDQAWTLAQYHERLADDLRRIPDLHYDIHNLLTGPDQVAARLWFDCSPQGEFLGIAVNGRRVAFAEHVFYRFRGGRIAEVHSLIDTQGIRNQLA
ncbi:ester cyclase [Kineosporia babensis]|uniref:Ester cyclase n=1 Tax=Kineosporia babensis TaxID=499548 RepID=A0A9X1NMY3_9ACTN|nr:ester cyclase [Kineosporia babensis]MCD5316071.1 ester cyclase [Kineosporia babensis]